MCGVPWKLFCEKNISSRIWMIWSKGFRFFFFEACDVFYLPNIYHSLKVTFKVVECHLDIYNAVWNILESIITKVWITQHMHAVFFFPLFIMAAGINCKITLPPCCGLSFSFFLIRRIICKQTLCISAIISRFNFILSPAPAMLFHSRVSLLKSSRSKLQAKMVLKLLC